MNTLVVVSAAFVVFLFVVVLSTMAAGKLRGASLALPSASLVIYLRERHLVGE